MTSLLSNLVALGRGYNTLPKFQKMLSNNGESRLKQIRIVPAGTATTAYFDYSAKLADLAAESPVWPPRTDDLAQIALDIEIERVGSVWSRLGPRRVRLEFLDYPGEWLLDLPLLSRSYNQWSDETLSALRGLPQGNACVLFLDFLNTIESQDIPSDVLIRRGHALYVSALQECRTKLGLRHLQPGRFLCPGPHGDAPYLWFFPLSHMLERPASGTTGALLRDRYEAYKHQVKTEFFDNHFTAFNRQIVLVDVLGALHAGRNAFEDTRRALADISNSMSYGSDKSSMIEIGAAALRAGKAILSSGGLRKIERIAFVATKADHVPALRRKNLENLLRDLVERAGGEQLFKGRPISFHTVAAVLSTQDDVVEVDGRPVEVVRGQLLGEDRDKAFFPGDVPSGRPPESFWASPFFELPCFKPPRIDPSGKFGIPHLGLDDVMVCLLKDVL